MLFIDAPPFIDEHVGQTRLHLLYLPVKCHWWSALRSFTSHVVQLVADKYAHCFVLLCVDLCVGAGKILRLTRCQWNDAKGYRQNRPVCDYNTINDAHTACRYFEVILHINHKAWTFVDMICNGTCHPGSPMRLVCWYIIKLLANYWNNRSCLTQNDYTTIEFSTIISNHIHSKRWYRIIYFCHELGDSAKIFTGDEVTSVNHFRFISELALWRH